MVVVGEGVHVGQDLAQGALPPVGFGVFLTGEPAEEIGRSVVELVRNEMVANADVGFAVFVGKRRSRTNPRECHERVAALAAKMPHSGVLGAADAVGRAPSFSSDGRERGLHLVHDASLVGNRHVVYAVEFARPTAIQRFVGGASSDDCAVR